MTASTEGPVGVVGAGTMGAGIAEAAARAGCDVRLHDPFPEAITRAFARIEKNLARSVERGSLDEAEAKAVRQRLEAADGVEALAGCSLVIEAAPEDKALKDDLFRRLDAACPPPAVLATNTSSLSVTAISSVVEDPARVVGMHFFNPAPVMRLVEVVAGAHSGADALAAVDALAERMGKTAVRASDTPGFIVNRVARPFYGEGLRILGEGAAGVEAVDAAMRDLGYRMGPFELMDLVGVDVNFAVTRSVWEATFQEARYRPHAIQRRLVEAGLHGRKTGAGFYTYDDDGNRLARSDNIGPAEPRVPALPPGAADSVTAVADRLALGPDAVEDGRAAIGARMLAMLVNEAVFATDDAVATPDAIDAAMRLGTNHPRGPFEWLSALGADLVLSVLEELSAWYREERYRPAPGLRRLAH